ncbi:MAG: hypothetical protein GEU71_04935 [Actinobacteria bacterium]|nr:hypothetical protein [Actinomycetota bacterium]
MSDQASDTTAPMPSGEGLFNFGKQKTIVMIVAGVVVVGGIGGLIGAMVGGGDDDKNVAAPGAGGSGILNPTPVGNTQPTPLETTEPTPQETTAPSPPPPGDGVTLGDGIATIPVPGGWNVLGQGDVDVLLGDDQGSWVYAIVGQEDPSTDAGSLLSQIVTDILPAENYSQLQLSEVSPIQPFGSMVSAAVVDYQALWVDSQGSMPLYGQLFVGIRQDGASLVMSAEHNPPEEFEASYSSWGPVIDGAYNAFASN